MPIKEIKENVVEYSVEPFLEPLKDPVPFTDSVVDWKNHSQFITQTICWICLLPLSRTESVARGMGPDCSGQGYKYDKDNIPDHVKETAKKNALKRYGDITSIVPIEEIGIVSYDVDSIQLQIKNKIFRLHRKQLVYFEGSLFISYWKYRDIVRELNTIDLETNYDWAVDDRIFIVGGTFPIKNLLYKAKFWYKPVPMPNWSIPKSFDINGSDLPLEIQGWLEKFKKQIVDQTPEPIEVIEDLNITAPEGFEYYDHQKVGIQLINQRQGYLLGDETGAGKTAVPLGYAYSVEGTRIFAVVPSSLRLNWYKEAETFGLDPFFFPKPPNMRKDKRKRFTKYNGAESRCVIAGYDMFRRIMHDKAKERNPKTGKMQNKIVLKDELLEEIADQFDLFVFDESHKLKNYNAIQTKVCLGLIKHAKKLGKKFVFMTGTPILNRPSEFYTSLKQLIPDLGNWFKFTARYNGAHQSMWGWEMGAPSNLMELHNIFKKVGRRVLKENCLDLPEKTRTAIELTNVNVNYPEPPEQPNQILGWMGKMKKAIAMGKIKNTINIIEDQEITPCLVFSHFIDVNNAITEALRKKDYRVGQIYSGIDMGTRNEVVEEYQAGQLDVVVLGIQSGGMGLTLTKGSTVIFNDQDWTPGNMVQAEDRAHRIGQKNAVSVNILLADDEEGFDDMLHNKIQSKYRMFKEVLDGSAKNFVDTSIMMEMMVHYTKKFGLVETEKGLEFGEDFLDKVTDELKDVVGSLDDLI